MNRLTQFLCGVLVAAALLALASADFTLQLFVVIAILVAVIWRALA